MAALGPDAHCASSHHRIEEMTDLSLRDGSPFSLDNSGQLRDGGGWIFHLVHSVLQSAPEIFDGAEIWAFGWPVHHIHVILVQLCGVWHYHAGRWWPRGAAAWMAEHVAVGFHHGTALRSGCHQSPPNQSCGCQRSLPKPSGTLLPRTCLFGWCRSLPAALQDVEKFSSCHPHAAEGCGSHQWQGPCSTPAGFFSASV